MNRLPHAACSLAFAALFALSATAASADAKETDGQPRERTFETELVPLTAFCKVLGTTVEGSSDRPIAGAAVELAGHRQLTLDNGLFEFDPVLVGRYALTARAHGYESKTVVVYATPPLATVRVELSPVLGNCPLVAAPEGPPADRDFPERTLVLNPPAPEPPQAPRKRIAKGDGKTSQGSARPSRSGAGAGTGRDAGSGTKRVRGTNEVAVEARVSVADGFGAIEGRVTETGTGAPVANAIVEIGPRALRAEADGRYRILDVPVGRYTIVGSHKGFRAAHLRLTVKRGATSTADLALEPENVAAPRAPGP